MPSVIAVRKWYRYVISALMDVPCDVITSYSSTSSATIYLHLWGLAHRIKRIFYDAGYRDRFSLA
ncbi:unnamed protein product [Callosobruchus maculatus]|uniref:Uncharacterized protein n=1 Tax=Callosobruchus maculatus TaxID=64391 RepID=A0A653D9J1_CALMS|nr:unnamed protein product [Callosobruchus maculatus]VEN56829.1 unnamed protein product [Callosobruchus maculatus]